MSGELAEIFALLRTQGETLAGIKATVDGVKENQDKDQTKADKLEGRVRKLENRQHWYAGLSAAASTCLTWIVTHKSGT